MENAIVVVDQLSHRYSVQWAVQNISFRIPAKGVYGLLGVNGAGKSTIMNILCGVLKQTMGVVKIGNIDIQTEPIAAKKIIGFLPQSVPLFNDFTVREYLTYSAQLRLLPDSEIPKAVDAVLEKCKITHFQNRLLKNLSGGYQQRVGIAQAIIHKPKLVVLDEPTNGLDPNQMMEVRSLIKSLAQDCAVIISSHILSEIEAICDHVLMMSQGTLVFNDTMEEFNNYLKPNSLYIKLMDPPCVEEIEKIEGVKEVEELDGMSFRIIFDNVQDVTDRLVDECARRHWGLVELKVEKISLDSIFSILSGKNK